MVGAKPLVKSSGKGPASTRSKALDISRYSIYYIYNVFIYTPNKPAPQVCINKASTAVPIENAKH